MIKSIIKKGFTLIEIMTAIAILGLVIVTICGVFIHGLNAIKKGKYRACAIHIAKQKFNELGEINLGDPSGIPVKKLSEPPPEECIEGWQNSDPDIGDYIRWDASTPLYKISGKQKMAGIEYDFDVVIEHYHKNLKKVTVKVTWKEIEGERKVELCTLLSRSM